ncbi:uncharacterized protein LOC124165465 [Ischnura elegans]|uniref:uncharacterized protein LOC124165465 n=1 Tax=Ischnura elegans TaxID=197161 RepID=UPI001ED8667C|nr:uncharacterized protein LOC124165465 [Ischnura elegans]
MAAAAGTSRGAVGLLKRGWHEIPEVMASTGLALIGLGLGCVGLSIYYSKDGNNRRYKNSYIVYRPDDPRVKSIKE